MNQTQIQEFKKAGQIARETCKYAKSIIKKDIPLLELAEKIESKIYELGGRPAFPINLSINDIAAHFTPSPGDKTKASGLLKIDLGVHINGQIADTAFSIDLENSEENKKLIEAAEKALQNALSIVKPDTEVSKIGSIIQKTIESYNFTPIRNLSGHSLSAYKVHAGITIPNCDNNSHVQLEQGTYAIEPFSTSGQGIVYEGKPSGIYRFDKRAAVRDSLARDIMDYIEQEYKGLPFCTRWIVKKFSSRALLSLKLMEQAKIIHQYPQLIEKGHGKVAHAEHSFLITDKVEVTTI
ncbi:MAG: type II methionyl aminopeptidase [archaeon]